MSVPLPLYREAIATGHNNPGLRDETREPGRGNGRRVGPPSATCRVIEWLIIHSSLLLDRESSAKDIDTEMMPVGAGIFLV